MFDEAAEPRFTRLAGGLAVDDLLQCGLERQRALHGGSEAVEPLLDDVVRGARLDVIGRRLLVDRSGHDEHGKERTFALYEVEDLESSRSGQRVIDEHDVRAKGRQGRDEGILTRNASRVHAESAAPQAVQHQLIIRFVVLGDQDTKLGVLHSYVWRTSPRVPSNSLL